MKENICMFDYIKNLEIFKNMDILLLIFKNE